MYGNEKRKTREEIEKKNVSPKHVFPFSHDLLEFATFSMERNVQVFPLLFVLRSEKFKTTKDMVEEEGTITTRRTNLNKRRLVLSLTKGQNRGQATTNS